MIRRSRLAKGIAKTELDYISFGFGLDLVSPPNQTKPGSLRACKNAEINTNGGYQPIQGYLKYDGQELGLNNTYYTIEYVDSTGSGVAVGQTVTEASGPTTAYVLAVITTDPDHKYLVLADVDGPELQSGQTLTYTGGSLTTTTDQGITTAITAQQNALYTQLSSIYWQSFIDPVPGSGHILGIWMFGMLVYAFRNNVGGTAAEMYVSSTGAGWTQIALGREMSFTSGGTTEILEGQTIVGLSSGATAVVTRVVLESGSWAAGTAQGRFIFASQTGTFTAAEGVQVGLSGDLATVTANSTAITLQPSGRYEFEDHNFAGSVGNNRFYGCDGVNRGFEFDPVSSVFVPINTGLPTDAPSHVAVHKEHLFFSYLGSVLHSGIGAPYAFTVLSGASEIVVGDEVTAFKIQPGSEGGGTLAVFTRNRIKILYGSNAGDLSEGGWNLVDYRAEVGAKPYSVQEFGFTLMMDDRGITSLESSQSFGNFASNVVSQYVQPFVNTRKNAVRDSSINREKSQYRIFFDDRSALYITTKNSKVLGIMQEEYAHDVYCVVSREQSDGRERGYFGSSEGWVYLMDTGTSFAGEDIDMLMALHFHHSKTPRYEKTYFDGSFEVSGSEYSSFDFRYELAYNLPTTPQPLATQLAVTFSSSLWDAMTWDAFVWDGTVLAPSNVDINGSGENISLIFSSTSNHSGALTFSGASLRLAYRKQLRS